MAFENLGKKLAQLGQDTKASVQKMSESYSLNSKLNEEKKALDSLFAQIGEAVFEKISEAPIPGLEGLEEKFGAVKAAKEVIKGLEDQVTRLRGVSVCPECGKEAAKGEKFCSACGAKLPEEEDPVDKMADSAKEVGNEVGDAVNEAADKARDFFGSMADKAGAFFEGVTSRLNAKKDDDDDEFDEDIMDVAEGKVEEVKEAAEEACEACEEASEEACAACKEKAEEVCEACEEAAEEVSEACEEAAEKACEACEEASEEACAACDAAPEKPEENAEA